MVELERDICRPSELILPPLTTAAANILSGASVISGSTMASGVLMFNETLGKLDFWSGDRWQTITSTNRA